MNYDHLNRGQAQTAYFQPPDPVSAQDIRDASLRNKADETNGYLRHAHNLLDELEDALHGPVPRGEVQASEKPAPGHPGLRSALSDASAGSSGIVGRLSKLLGSL